ncbi:Glycosyltransferase [Quillaja saponaria]|uniref:Glycosyltransferase n=1 Tax=Quillaja saponaria TaxID=32244 RepID=A0AAD7L1R0_QUISA|nr:Glycosyltransferase [Quillaja saponaria]
MTLDSTKTHVAVLAFPFSTHAAPLFAIISRLSSAARNTHFSFFNTSKSNNSIRSSSFKQNVRHNLNVYDVWDGVPEGYEFAGKPQEEIELFMKAAPESFLKSVVAAVVETGREVSCLVTDAFFWFAAEMAEDMGVPWVAFWTAGPASLSTHVYTDTIRNKIGDEGVFINSFQELDPIISNDLNSKFNKYLNVGPFNLISPPPPPPQPPIISKASGCIPWLDKQKVASVAYISFGSVTVPPSDELVALAEALEAISVPFIWSLRDNLKVHLPNGFLEKTKMQGMVIPWAPQSDILRQGAIGAFVTHCGWNSFLESVVGEVPMICRPFFGDQRLNARMIKEVWEIGVRVEGGVFTKSGIMKSLDLVLLQEKGKRMREKMKGLKELAEIAIGPKGSSTENYDTLLDVISKSK